MSFPSFSTGEVLTAADMNAVGLWRINEFTLSGGTTNLTNIFSTDYSNYLLIVSGVTTGSAIECTFQMLNNTTPATGANYNSVRWSSLSGGSSTTAQTSGRIITCGFTPQLWSVQVCNPAIAAKTVFNSQGQYGVNADLAYPELNGAVHTLATAYNGMSMIAPGTTWTAGKVAVYGYK